MAIGIGQRQFDQPPGLASGRPPERNAEATQAHLLPADIRHLESERREPVRPAWGGAGQFEEAAAQKVDHADHRAAVAILIEYPQTQDLLVEMPRLRHVARMQDQATRQHFHQTSTPSPPAWVPSIGCGSPPVRSTVNPDSPADP